MVAVGLFIAAVIGVAVAVDANHRYKSSLFPVLWGAGVFLLLILFLPLYLIVRPPRLDQ